MSTATTAKKTATALGILLALTGCQSAPLSPSKAQMENAAFMTTWATYRHCQTGTDVDAMNADVRLLTHAETTHLAKKDAAGFVPEFVEHLVAKPAVRLAADPSAMVVACALSTGQMALRADRLELATEMFQRVLHNRGQDSAYYAGQARLGLNIVERNFRAPARKTDGTPRVLSVSSDPPEFRPAPPALLED